MKLRILAVPLLIVLAGVLATPVSAQSLSLSSTVLNSPGGCTSTSSAQCPESYEYGANPGAVTSVTAAPTTYTLANTFNQSGALGTLSDFGVSAYSSNCPASPNCTSSNPFLDWNFQDNYEFLTPSSGPNVQGAVLSFTVGNVTGLQNLEARIVSAPASPTAANLIGSGVVTVVDGWQSFTDTTQGSLSIYQATLNTTALNANTDYYLQVRGEALSSAGYSGTVEFTPVPLPANLGLLLSGCACLVLGRFARPRARGDSQAV
jgi:hypothetical protein